jgi:hypothetical protein
VLTAGIEKENPFRSWDLQHTHVKAALFHWFVEDKHEVLTADKVIS